jgi:enediyne biosynthesis protein CalE5
MTEANQLKELQRASWEDTSAGWEKHYDWYVETVRPMIDWVCDVTALAPGKSVLDVACGTGQPALSAAQRVGPSGSVVAIDLAPSMVAATARRAKAMGLTNVEAREMDAEALDFPANRFDAVTFTTGIMFCADPVKAVAEIRRVLKSGGRYAIVVWDEPAKNPYFGVLNRAAGPVLNAPPPPPDSPGAFRFAQPGALERLVRAGGFTDVQVASLPMVFDCGSVENYLRIALDLRSGLKAKLNALSGEDRARFEALVREGAKDHMNEGQLRLRATVLCASGSA